MMLQRRLLGPALVSLAASVIGCGDLRLQAIDDGEGGAGVGGNGAGASGAGAPHTPSPTDGPENPVLFVVQGDGDLVMFSDLARQPLGFIAQTNSYVESTYHVIGQRNDLVAASDGAPGTVDVTVQTNAVNQGGVVLQQTFTLPLETVGSVPQVAVEMQHSYYFWMLSMPGPESPGPDPVGNRLYWGQGDFGPVMGFVGFEANPPITAWTILPNDRTVVGSTANGLIQVEAKGVTSTLDQVGGPVVATEYTMLKTFRESLYAVTAECAGACLGELHIWHDLGSGLNGVNLSGPPDAVIVLPDGSSTPTSLSVGTRGVLVGTSGVDPQLLLYRGAPSTLAAGDSPDEQIAMNDDVLEVESVHWGDDDELGRRLSVYLRGTSSSLRAYEDTASGPLISLGSVYPFNDVGQLLDIHVAD